MDPVSVTGIVRGSHLSQRAQKEGAPSVLMVAREVKSPGQPPWETPGYRRASDRDFFHLLTVDYAHAVFPRITTL